MKKQEEFFFTSLLIQIILLKDIKAGDPKTKIYTIYIRFGRDTRK